MHIYWYQRLCIDRRTAAVVRRIIVIICVGVDAGFFFFNSTFNVTLQDMALSVNTMRRREYGIMRTTRRHLLYTVCPDRRKASLYFEIGDDKYRLYRKERIEDEVLEGQVHETMYRGLKWKEFCIWYFQQNVEGLINKDDEVNEDDYGKIISCGTISALTSYDKIGYSFVMDDKIFETNVEDFHVMINNWTRTVRSHLTIDFVAANVLYYKSKMTGSEYSAMDKYDLVNENPKYNICIQCDENEV